MANYGAIATPLTRLTKKKSFRWTEEATKAFELLKKAMVTLPDFQLPFEIERMLQGSVLAQFYHRIRDPLHTLARDYQRQPKKDLFMRES